MNKSTNPMETKGFFSGLFDFGFTSFITLRFMKVIYAILVVLILLAGAIFLIGGLSALVNGEASGLLLLIVAPLVTLLYLVMARIWMEMIALFFRIGENTSIMASAVQGPGGGTTVGAAGGPSGSTPPPPGGWGAPTPPPAPGPGPAGPY